MHENPRIRIDDAWPDDSEHLDDFMATDVAMVHFEALDQSQWYMTIELKDGQDPKVDPGTCYWTDARRKVAPMFLSDTIALPARLLYATGIYAPGPTQPTNQLTR
jgi:hypothetical protein